MPTRRESTSRTTLLPSVYLGHTLSELSNSSIDKVFVNASDATAVAATTEGLSTAVIDLNPQVERPVVISAQAARLPRILDAAE